MSEPIRPSFLKPGGVIGFAAPAYAVPEDRIQRGIDYFIEKGYTVRVAPNADAVERDEILNKLAGADADRIASTNALFAADDIDAILCLTGGYGVTRTLKYLDYGALKRHPKVITGFSDITALHSAVYRETGQVTLHSPNIDSMPLNEATERIWIKAIAGDISDFIPTNADGFDDEPPLETWKPGQAQGVLFGGNLTLIAALAGTPWDIPRDRDVILFLEDVGEFAYRIDVMLLQLWQAGLFERVSGLVLGRFTKRKAQEDEPDDLMERVLKSFCEKLDIPILANFPLGHVKKNFTIAHGALATLDATEQTLIYS